jgi:hypothetical protein
MREWWHRHSAQEKGDLIARRDREKVREQDRRKMARRRSEGSPEQKQKIAARAEVQRAIASGRLTRDRCEAPGCGRLGHAHHDDYSRPLAVRWLCREHHDELHHEDYTRRAA